MPVMFAQEPAPAQKAAGADAGPFGGGFPLLLILGLGLWIMVVMLPAERRRKKDQEKLVAELKPGKKVVTTGGIVGVVVTASDGDDELTIRSADSKLKVRRGNVVQVLGDDAPAAGK